MKASKSFEQLTLKERIGQLFMCGFDGMEPSEDIVRLIEEYSLGGIVYFRRNVANARQVERLSGQLQAVSASPLFIAIDQEGGMVVRLEEGVTVMPGAMAQGAADDEELSCEAARLSGAELRAIGINMNFAPCLDVNNNPANPVIGVRSFGEDPAKVAQLGAAAIRGYRAGGVVAVAKHFPGHGDTSADSHYELPLVPHDRSRLEEVELLPFRHAIEQQADALMTAHVVFPAFEPDNTPATLSQRILTGLLRSRLGFQGVIVTDCLEMKAIAETIGVARGAVEAIKAGADLVLVSHRLHRQKAALEAVMEAVLAGELSEARIDEAARRIWELKQARGLFGNERPAAERAQAEAVRAELCERAITIVRGEKHLPLDPRNKIVAVWTEPRERTEVIEVIAQEWTLGAALAQQGYTVKEIRIGTDPSAEEAAAVKTAAGTGSQVVFASYDAAFSASQAALIRELNADRQLPLIWAATRTPYDLLAVPEAPVYVCAYENKPAMMTALAALLSGKLRAQARQPITIGPHARASAKD